MKELLSDQHKLHRLAFAESSVDRKWDRVIFTDESTFSTANDGDGLQYQHILQNVMVPSVRMLYPDGIIHLQQDHSSIHDSRVVQEWLSRQADVGSHQLATASA